MSSSQPSPFPQPQEHRTTCAHPECPERTHERKPYCLAHLMHLPHAREVLRELARREHELSAAAKPKTGWKAVNIAGTRAMEILATLAHRGETTLRRLHAEIAKDEGENKETEKGKARIERGIDGYLEALERAGKLRVYERYTDHGMMWFVRLVEEDGV